MSSFLQVYLYLENDSPNKLHPRKASVVTPVSDNIGFKITKLTRDRDGHFIMIKQMLHQEDITLFNIYATKKHQNI